MPSHRQQHISPHTPEQLYQLVADVEKYPEFLPWCKAVRITERFDGGFLAEMVIRFKQFSESYISRVTLHPHSHIKVELVEGPFEYLINEWEFKRHEQGTDLHFFVDFKFKSMILGKMIGFIFDDATMKMMGAFEERADKLYGKG